MIKSAGINRIIIAGRTSDKKKSGVLSFFALFCND